MSKFPEIVQTAVLPTAVLPYDERALLWEAASRDIWLLPMHARLDDDGENILLSSRDVDRKDMAHVTVYVEETNAYDMNRATDFPILLVILTSARKAGVRYVRFDRDAADAGDWPTYLDDHPHK